MADCATLGMMCATSPTRVATTGMPQAVASSMAMGSCSVSELRAQACYGSDSDLQAATRLGWQCVAGLAKTYVEAGNYGFG